MKCTSYPILVVITSLTCSIAFGCKAKQLSNSTNLSEVLAHDSEATAMVTNGRCETDMRCKNEMYIAFKELRSKYMNSDGQGILWQINSCEHARDGKHELFKVCKEIPVRISEANEACVVLQYDANTCHNDFGIREGYVVSGSANNTQYVRSVHCDDNLVCRNKIISDYFDLSQKKIENGIIEIITKCELSTKDKDVVEVSYCSDDTLSRDVDSSDSCVKRYYSIKNCIMSVQR